MIYGAPKIYHTLLNNGIRIALKTVSNYMKELGIKAIYHKKAPKTIKYNDKDNIYKNILNREFNVTEPNKVWCIDVTFIHTLNGFVYLTSIMDLYSRKIIAWNLSNKQTIKNVIDCLSKAIKQRGINNKVILHSDRGFQFTSNEYIEYCKKNFILSYSKKGNPYDNACIESFHSSIKKEWLNRFIINNIREAKSLVFEYIEIFYNNNRIHKNNNFISPFLYEKT